MDNLGMFFHKFVPLGFKIEHPDEGWEFKEEPHVERRQAILKKYPEIKKLMGYDPNIAIYISISVFAQIIASFLLRNASWYTIIVFGYLISGTLNHSLGAAIHELGHNLAFGHKHPLANRMLGMWANLPFGVPMSVTYKKYHADHHRFLGHDTMDVDIPSVMESYLFRHPITKFLWLLLFPIIHAIRPYCKSPIPLLKMELLNFAVQLIFDLIILKFFGYKSLVYFILGTFLGLGGLHPLSGHFISEHYLFIKGQATRSYYGPLNYLMYNLGYHVEHHDFPYIPYRKLPKIREIAPEFYEDLPFHSSWIKVLWDFIFESDMGPHARGVGYLPDGVTEEIILNKKEKSTDCDSALIPLLCVHG